MIGLTVARCLREHASNSAALVRIDPVVMAAHGLQAGDLLRIATFRGEILARLDQPDDEDRGTGHIRLDRFQRQSLQARLHQPVELIREREQPVKKVRLRPAVDLGSVSAHHLEEHLKEELVRRRSPVTKGALLFLHFHHSVAGALYKVLDVEPADGVVTSDTELALDLTSTAFARGVELELTFDDVGGLDREITLLNELVRLPLQFPALYRQIGIAPVRGVILYGPPGTGKTLLARATANEIVAQFYYINGPEIIGTNYGESEANLRRIFGEATHHAPSIIFIDELDVIAGKRGESGAQADTRLATQLLSLMDGLHKVEGVLVVGTTNRIEALDVALRRPGRFDRELYIGPPDAAGRAQILSVHTREMPLDDVARTYLEQLAADTPGFVGADLMALCREAGLQALRRHLPAGLSPLQVKPELARVQREDFLAARRQCRPSAARATLVAVPQSGFDRIGGLARAKKQLQSSLIAPLRAGDTISDGVLLYGPPGIGKSLLARAVAKEAGVNLLIVGGPELFSKWLGESEEAVRHVFKLARELAPSLLFFDQLDALAPVRGRSAGSWTTERVVHQLLAELEEIGNGGSVGVIGATNRLDLVDEALLQPGRFGTLIGLSVPDGAEREQILALYLAEPAFAFEGQALANLAASTAGWSGAKLRALAVFLRNEKSKTDDAPWDVLFKRWQNRGD
ncbi:MAG: AAA family ATPase [Burkholderiales bacterium]|nr:AAA family ATPase [Burkholderiales bacterium]